MTQQDTRSRLPIYGLFALVAIWFAANIWGYDLWPPDEPRFAESAREIVESGDWLVLRVNGEPYAEKPPLLMWAIALLSLAVGDVTSVTARMPSVLSALAALWFTWLLARRLYGGKTALWSVLILATYARFWWQARTGQIDMLLTACLAGALWAFWMWHESRRIVWLVAFYGAITAAVYAKGPPGLVFPLLLIFVFYWKHPLERKATHWVWGLLAVTALISLWFIPARMAISSTTQEAVSGSLQQDLFRQTVGRMFLGVSKAQWPWYYFTTLPVDWLPWSFYLPWLIPWIWKRRREDERMRFLLAWLVPAIIFFSICVGKRQIYLLPIYPAMAILMARAIPELAGQGWSRLRMFVGLTWCLLLLAVAVAPLILPFTEYAEAWDYPLIVMTISSGIFATHMFWLTLKHREDLFPLSMVVHFTVLALLASLIMMPVINPYKSARAFCAPVRALTDADVDYRLYSVLFSREEFVLYSRKFHQPVMTDILPVDAPEGVSLTDVATQQRRLRKDIAEAVEDMHGDAARLPDIKALGELRDMMAQRIREDAELDQAVAGALQKALMDAVKSFYGEMSQSGPAFAFIQREDWAWMAALHMPLTELVVVHQAPVGRRDLMLLANRDGLEQLKRITAEKNLF